LTRYLTTAIFGQKAPAPGSPLESRVHCAAELLLRAPRLKNE